MSEVDLFCREAGPRDATVLLARRDLPDAEIVLLDAGHFAPEAHAAEIAAHVLRFPAGVSHGS